MMYRIKIILPLLLSGLLTLTAFAQPYSLTLRDVTVQDAMEQIQNRFGYSFVIRSTQVDLARKVSISATDANIEDILSRVFAGQDVVYSVDGKNIQVSRAEKPVPEPAKKEARSSSGPERNIVNGRVVDQAGEPVIGCVVIPGNATQKAATTAMAA